jgi:uncharacterized protein YydD (DUF2326 family)
VIHSISSTVPSFKSLSDLKPGLNVLLAEKSEGATAKQTRNRAGKTSLIEIVHFLTGSDAGPESIFRTRELAGQSFSMDFDLKSERTIVERSGGTKAKVYFTKSSARRVKVSPTEWCAILGEGMFGLSSLEAAGAKPPSFRSLFAYFVRRQVSTAFVTPEKQAVMQGTGDYQMALMFLLDLDWQIARDWQIVRDREKTLEELRKAAATGAFGSMIGKAADLRTQLTIEEARLRKLRVESTNFRVLPQYSEFEAEGASLTRRLNELANANTVDLSAVGDLERALASEVPPNLENLESVYEEVGIALPDLAKRRYEDVKSFHESVVRNRKDYLSGELEAAKLRIAERDVEKASLDSRRAEVMNLLKSHGALDQFLKLQGELGRLESEAESLRQRFETAEQLEGTKNELEIERNRLAIRLRRDFAEQKEKLSEAIVAFEETSQGLYESAGSMTIEETQNGPVFKFPMQGERSKGIKNIQIFCFDMMLMRVCAKRGIGPGFLIHDSHLFDGVDGRQVVSALRVGAEISSELGFQYLVTMNEDDAFKEASENFNLSDYLMPTRLTDATDDGGLFGIRFG